MTALLTLAGIMLLGVVANTAAGIGEPGAYVDLYGERAWFPYYQNGSKTLSVAQLRNIGLAGAAYQLTVALLLITGRYVCLALVVAIAFLLGVAGLGPENVVDGLRSCRRSAASGRGARTRQQTRPRVKAA